MYHKLFIVFLFVIGLSLPCQGQYQFSGNINQEKWDGELYLSIIQDYRKISGVYPEQIIAKTLPDSLGHFKFTGDNIPLKNNLYRIHVDNCSDEIKHATHFTGYCPNSTEILFVAGNKDTITFPFTGEREMFCSISSKNEKANALIKIDSLKELMSYEFGAFPSQAKRDLNAKKWFKEFHNYGVSLEEPLAELYIYAFISDRSSNLYSYYLEDFKDNNYYSDLLSRLKTAYPEAPYTRQYENELRADSFLTNTTSSPSWLWWSYLLIILCILSILVNMYLLFFKKKRNELSNNSTLALTKQEKRILDLILDDCSNKEIAATVFVSISTVKTHINNIYKKLNITSREEAKSLYKSS